VPLARNAGNRILRRRNGEGAAQRARNVLLTEAIVTEEQLETVAEDMLGLEGMDKPLAAKLAGRRSYPATNLLIWRSMS
jgi:hypothetical protein